MVVGVLILIPQTLTPETISRHPEIINRERVVYRLGQLAIEREHLGINDPLTHLCQYIEKGESALIGIKEDLETGIAERLPETPFVNYVGFEFTGDDFVSLKDRISMNSMTKTNLQIFEDESSKNPDLKDEFERAKTEAQEANKLAVWFKDAPIGAYMIFESLPIGEQEFAISRIYQKVSDDRLEGCFVSLYSSSIEQFNDLREALGLDMPAGQTEKEILQNHFEFYEPNLTAPGDFIDFYVDTYDYLLQKRDGEQYSFGLEADKKQVKKNGLKKTRNQSKLISIYLDTIKALASSGGLVTPELMHINKNLDMGYRFKQGQFMSKEIIHDMMSDVILGITSVIDRANEKVLNDLEHSDSGQEANFAAVSFYKGQAKEEGETYTSNGCPEYSRSNPSESSNDDTNLEYDAMLRAFNVRDKLDDFGKPKIGTCRILNCPSRGNLGWMPDKTLVGGCDICVCCHKLFKKGKSPKTIYTDRELKQESSKRLRRTDRPILFN